MVWIVSDWKALFSGTAQHECQTDAGSLGLREFSINLYACLQKDTQYACCQTKPFSNGPGDSDGLRFWIPQSLVTFANGSHGLNTTEQFGVLKKPGIHTHTHITIIAHFCSATQSRSAKHFTNNNQSPPTSPWWRQELFSHITDRETKAKGWNWTTEVNGNIATDFNWNSTRP